LNEKTAFKKKIEIEFQILKKQRDQEIGRLNYKFKVRKNVLENQQHQEKKLNENDNFMKQKTICETIRGHKNSTKSDFLSASTKMTKTDRKILKTEIDISVDMQMSGSVTDK